jgi:hypothetical protein
MKLVLTLLIIVCCLFVYRVITYPDFDKIFHLLRQKDYGINNLPPSYDSTYKSDVALEDKMGLRFPLVKVEYAKVYNGILYPSKKLDESSINEMIDILNDTSSYIWGEVGTFLPDRRIIYYDKQDKPVAITEIDLEGGFTNSIPYLKRTKWQTMTGPAFNKLEKIISW